MKSGHRFVQRPISVPILVLIGHLITMSWYKLDDAWISFRYARNLIDGLGLVYNAGERVEGYTNFLWVLITALLMQLGSDPVVATKVLGGLFSLATLPIVYAITVKITPQIDPRPKILFLAPWLVALNICWAAYAVSGMETALYAFLATSLVWGGIRVTHPSSALILGLVAALTAMTRPDGLLFVGCVWLYLVYRTFWAGEEQRLGPKTLILYTITFGSLYGAYFVWRFSYYGYLLPNTFYAKVGNTQAQVIRGIRYVLRFLAWFFWGGLLYLLPLLSLLLLRKPRPDTLYVIATSSLYLTYVAYVGGDGNPLFRFMVPILPLLAAQSVAGIPAILSLLHAGATRIRPVRSLLRFEVLLTVVIVLAAPLPLWSHYYRQARANSAVVEGLIDRGKWLQENVPPTDTLATYSAGAVAYYSELHTYDMLGLTDAHIAHREMEGMGTFHLAGHEKNDPEYIFEKRPDWVLVSIEEEHRWVPGTNELVAQPGFQDLYEVFSFSTERTEYRIFHLR